MKIALLLLSFALASRGFTADPGAKCLHTAKAKCTGSAACAACKNCKYCKHCTAGGTCGVCKPARKKG